MKTTKVQKRFQALAKVALIVTIIPALAMAAWGNPPLPAIPPGSTNIVFFGAVGDGVVTNTTAIQDAINTASSMGIGTVEIPAAAGAYLCGPLTFKSSINLQIDASAILQMLPRGDWPGNTTFINGSGLHDVEISGSGAIDGNANFGSSDWWGPTNGSPASSRPDFINFSGTARILIQDVTLRNPPTFHLMLKGNNSDVTIQRITINTPGDSPNTDGMDLGSTNVLVQNCSISDGDDNIEIGGSSATAAYITITNCAFGTGHGVSVGSDIQAGVSNVTVINCTFSSTTNGIRMKSDNNRGGLVQNLSYFNIGMTNVGLPIQIYSYYNSVGTPDNVSPQQAASEKVAAVTNTTPIWRDITISNLTVNSPDGNIGGIIWGRSELLVSNVTLSDLKITAPKTFDIYNARGITIADSQFTFASGSTLTLYNAQVTVTNSTPAAAAPITLDGLTTNSIDNTLRVYNALVSLSNTNLLDTAPVLSIGGTTLTVENNLNLTSSTVLNFVLGTNTDTIVVKTNLALAGTLNIQAGPGFGLGNYTLLTCGGALSLADPVLGATPETGHAYVFSLSTNTPKQIDLVVAAPPPPMIESVQVNNLTNLVISGGGGTTNFDVYLLVSTNLALPLTNWTCISTNRFIAGGTFTSTNSLSANAPQEYFLLQYP